MQIHCNFIIVFDEFSLMLLRSLRGHACLEEGLKDLVLWQKLGVTAISPDIDTRVGFRTMMSNSDKQNEHYYFKFSLAMLITQFKRRRRGVSFLLLSDKPVSGEIWPNKSATIGEHILWLVFLQRHTPRLHISFRPSVCFRTASFPQISKQNGKNI